jgi:hypothetical protein
MFLDDAAVKYNMTFSASIIRRALKMMLFEDVKLLEFDRVMGATRETIKERFENDQENPKETADDFFATTIAQSLQKLVKSVIAQKKERKQLDIVVVSFKMQIGKSFRDNSLSLYTIWFSFSTYQHLLFKMQPVKLQEQQLAIDKLTKFLDAIYGSPVSNLADEAGIILDLIRKDSAPLAKLKFAVEHMSNVSKLLGKL